MVLLPSSTIQNGANVPLNFQQGTVPNMSESLTDWFQVMTFTKIVKTVVGFQVLETPTDITFMGIMQPYTGRQLAMLPEGQRVWNWQTLHSQPVLTLFPDDVVTWQNMQVRIMSRKDYALYSYIEYSLVLDYINSGPPTP
jgi:hypothetical protein